MVRYIIIIIILFIHQTVLGQPHYVTTIQPFRMIVEELTGDDANVDCILPPGSSPHTYELRPSDVRKIDRATALIMGGKNLDDWAYSFECEHRIELIKYVPHEFYITSVPHSHGHHHEEVHDIDTIDPHFWTDPKIIEMMVPGLVVELQNIDPENAEIYQKRAQIFIDRLKNLQERMEGIIAEKPKEKVLLSHPFYKYYLKRFDIELLEVIEKVPGKSPSPRYISQIIKRSKKNDVKIILTHPQLPDRAARIVAESIGGRIVELDPLGGKAGRDTYIELIEYNTKLLVRNFRRE